jgi:HSP20 family protein
MSEADNSDEFTALKRSMDAIFARAFAGIEDSLFDMESMSLKPLFRVEVNDEAVTVVLDLPQVEKKDLVLSSTEDTLSVEARLREPVKLRVASIHRSSARFEKYSKRLKLPVKVSPGKASAKFKKGILVVKLPRARTGKAVKIS